MIKRMSALSLPISIIVNADGEYNINFKFGRFKDISKKVKESNRF